jgi:hypothetical protein
MSRSTETQVASSNQNLSRPPDLVDLAVKGQKALFTEGFKNLLTQHVDEAINESFEDEVAESIPEVDVDEDENDELNVINQISQMAGTVGGYVCGYEEGVLDICVHSGIQAKQFASFLDNYLPVDDYDCYEVTNFDDGPDDHIPVEIDHDSYDDWDKIKIDSPLEFQFIVYLDDDLVDGDDVLIDVDDFTPDEETVGEVFEVMKVVKINFKGKKVIRMKCQKGYKYDTHQHTCVKRGEHDIFMKRRKLQLNMLRRVASKAAIKKKINHKSLRFLLNRKRLGIGY